MNPKLQKKRREKWLLAKGKKKEEKNL